MLYESNSSIEAFLEGASEKKLEFLFSKLKYSLHKFKELYKSMVLDSPKCHNDQIIYDNYYIIEKFGKLLLKDDKKAVLTVNKAGFPILGEVVLSKSFDGNIPSTDSIVSVINEVQEKRYISNIELEYMIWAFRYTTILKLEKYALAKEHDCISMLELITLLARSDTFDTRTITKICNPLEILYNTELCGVYPQMDELTRQYYRSKTSAIANKKGKKEFALATEFLELANNASKNGRSEQQSHIGYYIYKEYNSLFRCMSAQKYVCSLGLFTVIFSVLTSILLESFWLWLPLLFVYWEIFRVIVDIIASQNSEVTYLPRLELKNKVPEDASTLITISTLLSTTKDSIRLKEKLIRLHFLNPSENMKICALCDLRQSELPSISDDKAIIRGVSRLIKKLNVTYDNRFVLIIRKRTYSETQQMFTGFERKRGAIEQLVKIIKGENIELAAFVGDMEFLKKTKFIAALDYDTKALMDTISELVGIAIHPLNKPIITGNSVSSGYGIISPLVTTQLVSSLRSPFSKLVGGVGSSCAYDTVCANLYQDCFHEGIFSGKGLISVDAFYELCCDFFPNEQILSHDILEGGLLRTAFAGDVEFSDGFPSSAISFFKRSHRWIRGDIQNISYIGSKVPTKTGMKKTPFSFLDRFKLFDNIRRAVEPIALFAILFLSFFIKDDAGFAVAVLAIFAVFVPYFSGFISSIISNGVYSLGRKYYSGVISHTTELISQGFYAFIMLPQYAIVSIDGVSRSLWRKLVSNKKLLEWTTADQTERNGNTFLGKMKYYSVAEISSLVLIFSPLYFVRLIAIFFSLMPLLIFLSDKPYTQNSLNRPPKKASKLEVDLATMWQFYEDFATQEEHYLPPDNVQFAPVYRICHRTSPTNIGLFLLSILVARDFDLIDSNGLYQRVNRTITTVEGLEKFNGNLYNWYETQTLQLSSNPYVSSVDSGNFACCLVALKEGLREYISENDYFEELIVRINKLIDATDISCFYDESKGLLSIGYNPQTQGLSPNHYDLLMSEARMTSYFAIAKRQIPKKHWRYLGRTMARLGLYAGPVSYSGTMFEFFMPELLLDSENGSLLSEGLKFCIYCQKKRAKITGVPFGISESGYYAFDSSLNYQYKAHGVQRLGLKRGLDNDLVISPYSSYLSLEYDFDASFANLERLKKYGMLGDYGYYEAIDFTANRSPNGGTIIKSYMAHHVGMSILSVANAIHFGAIQKRFMRDSYMRSADELLEEKVIAGAVMFEDVFKKQAPHKVHDRDKDIEYFENIYPSQPNIKLLCNGEYTLALTDLGASIGIYQGKDVYLRTTDLLRRPQGCYFAVQDEDKHFCLTYLPEFINSEEMSVEFGNDSVSYFSNSTELQLGMKVQLHSNLPCEIREFAMKNNSSSQKKISLISYIEPVLSSFIDNSAHPAFSKLFLKEHYDIDTKAIIVSRKNRHNDEGVYCAIAFIEEIELNCNLNREEVLSRPDSVSGVFNKLDDIINNYESIPDPCVFLKTDVTLAPREQKTLSLFICMALSMEELYQRIARIRHDTIVISTPSTTIIQASIEGRLVNSILPQILFKKRDCTQINLSIEKNQLPLSSMWGLGISGDIPIILVELSALKDDERINAYIKAHYVLRLSGIQADLVFTFNDLGQYERPFYNMILSAIDALCYNNCIAVNGGIHLVNLSDISADIHNLLRATAIHIAPISMVRIGVVTNSYIPIVISPVSPQKIDIKNKICYGGFDDKNFFINEKPPLPWCHVLSNPVFGTLLSEGSLGYTYAINSRENKLTPWFNDTRSDNRGELLLVKTKNKCFDIILGSAVSFSKENAVYYGSCELFDSKVTVSVSATGMCKKIEFELSWKESPQIIEIAFFTEPVLGVSRDNSRMIVFEYNQNAKALTAKNPTNRDIVGYMAISTNATVKYFITNREAFLNGKWNESNNSSSNEPCACLIINHNAKKDKKASFQFFISFGKTLSSALKMPSLFKLPFENNRNSIKITTPDNGLDAIFNNWLDWQALGGRMYAKTGFYQNSGAFGFRDQLQDACGCLLNNPVVAKRQIVRACTAQFIEGDVLHWWHKLPNAIMRGVRTRYSDDLVWLPYSVCEFIDKTTDVGFLAVNVAYCEGLILQPEKHDIYGEVHRTVCVESIYNHCKRALDCAFKLGEHNLILMGCGDWNDSFNGVGIKGKGESVWLSQFMIIVFKRFSEICERIGDFATKEDYLSKANLLSVAIEEHCWDGEWYLRAFFDDGTELGSRNCEACQIDSLAQSFAVLSELPTNERNKIALNSAYSELVDKKNGIIKLFTPPFQRNEMPVGYATSYPRGIRENGGQYTHGAIWLCIALMKAGENEKGFELINILNPLNKYKSIEIANQYKNEPYYISADIYTNPQCYGRGGWSIYTGAASWYYRSIFEWFLGINIKNNEITLKPILPLKWNEYEVELDYFDTKINIFVTHGNSFGIFENDRAIEIIPLDKKTHEIRVVIANK